MEDNMANADVLWEQLNHKWSEDDEWLSLENIENMIPLGTGGISNRSSYDFAMLTLLATLRRNYVKHKEKIVEDTLNIELEKTNRNNGIWRYHKNSLVRKQNSFVKKQNNRIVKKIKTNKKFDNTYNQWYNITYETILKMVDWNHFSKDIDKKIVCIFSWMPMSIMNIKTKKESNANLKSQLFNLDDVTNGIVDVEIDFNKISNQLLIKVNLEDIKKEVIKICSTLFKYFGSVASSKYLHFSAPKLFPMWDSNLRISEKLKDNSDGYYEYMKLFRDEIINEDNYKMAIKEFDNNVLRGWDICRMKRRN